MVRKRIGGKFRAVLLPLFFVFHTQQGVLYLSMIRDLYDNSIIAYKTGIEQTINLVLDTVKAAKKKKRSLQRCNSTATKAGNINIHPTNTIT